MTNPNYELLSTVIESEAIEVYQASSILSYIPAVPIPGGIATEEWARKYFKETIRAALTERGFHPNQISIDFDSYKIKPYTIAQEMVLTEKDQAFFAENGMLEPGINNLGDNLAFTANTAFMSGKGGNSESFPYATQYNYLLDPGSSYGTGARPNMVVDGSGTKWNHSTAGETNFIADITGLIGALRKNGYKNIWVVLPKVITTFVMKPMNTYKETTLEQFILKQPDVKGIIWMDDDIFLTNDLATAPTVGDFDIVAFDPTEVVIGYERAETITSGKGTFPDRNFYAQGEIWCCPLFIPKRKNVGGTMYTYKGVSRYNACDCTSTS